MIKRLNFMEKLCSFCGLEGKKEICKWCGCKLIEKETALLLQQCLHDENIRTLERLTGKDLNSNWLKK